LSTFQEEVTKEREMSRVAIALSHGHAAKWLQVIIHSLKTMKNEMESDIYVAATWPGHPSIKAITETPLGDDVHVMDCVRRKTSHATGLDEILEHIAPLGYDYMFCTETDCRAMKPGWLDWYYNFMKNDPKIGMAGFFWNEGRNHYNINPSATLYRVDMLMKYHKESRENNEGMFYHPRGNRADTEKGMDTNIKEVAGVFSETRGIKNPSPEQEKQILRGVPQAAWFEPGAWLYYKSIGEYTYAAVPNDHIYTNLGGGRTPEGTYYGGKKDPYFIHFWGGTRAWDHLKHPVHDMFVKKSSKGWLNREDKIWKETVPEEYRQIVSEIYEEIGIEGMGYDKS
jgi:hypothetical protein